MYETNFKIALFIMEYMTGITRRFLKVHYIEVHDSTSFVYTIPLYKHSYLAAVR